MGEHIQAPERAVVGRRKQIRPQLAAAIRLIVDEGASIPEAAERVKMQLRSLQAALRKPHIKAHLADVKRAWMTSQTRKAWTTVAQLADGAASEDVRHKAARTILEAAGELGGRGQADDQQPRQLVQIITQAVNLGAAAAQATPGIIEAPPFSLPAKGDE